MQNCTNQVWDISNSAGTAVDASTRPGVTKDIRPTDALFTDPAAGQANPFDGISGSVPSWDLR